MADDLVIRSSGAAAIDTGSLRGAADDGRAAAARLRRMDAPLGAAAGFIASVPGLRQAREDHVGDKGVDVVHPTGDAEPTSACDVLVATIVGLNSFLDTPALFPLFGLPLALEPGEVADRGDGTP